MVVCTRKRRRAIEQGRLVSSSLAMKNLPSHILMEIFSRLPIKAVMAVRCVCKSLLKLVSEPYFKELFLTRAPTEVYLLRSYGQERTLYTVDPVFQDYSSVDIKFNLVFGLPNFSVQSNNDINFRATESYLGLVNACNGLLCFYGLFTNQFAVICNPIRGEYVTIPGPDMNDKTVVSGSTLYGLGFSSKDNRFKLLRLLCRRNVDAGRMFSEIYTFGESGSWKTVANCPDIDLSRLSEKCTFCEGVLHWYSRSSGDILTFDFHNEEFGKINSPYFWAKEMEYANFTRLGVLGGCLYKTASVGDCVEVWVMKQYGVQSSWIKAFSIQKDIWSSGQSYEPIKYFQNGEILMMSAGRIVCYNQDTGSVRVIGSCSDYLGFEAISMKPSLVPLNVLLGDNVKVCNAKSRGAHKKLSEVAGLSPWLTRIRLVEDTARRLKLLQEKHALRDPEVYPQETDYLQRRIQNLMKLLHLCRDIPPQTAAEPPPAATDLAPDANTN